MSLQKVHLKKSTVTVGLIFVILLAGSLVLFFIQGKTREKRVLFFSLINNSRFIGETRYLPDKFKKEDDVEQLISEIILGPENENHFPVLPPETEIKSVLLRDNILYANFSYDALKYNKNVKIGTYERFQIVADTVIFNFPFIKRIFFYINGEPFFDKPLSDGLVFKKGYLY